jgi:hypothetical protein
VTPEDFDALFDRFHSTVVRLETLPAYSAGGAEAERIEAWRRGEPRPERSVRTSPWLARIAVTTATAGKSWSRVRVLDDPPTDYQRYQLASYVESQAAGEVVSVARRGDVRFELGPDFWLFDGGTDDAYAAVMRYDVDGKWLGVNLVTDTESVADMHAHVRAVAEFADSLNTYLARGAAVRA